MNTTNPSSTSEDAESRAALINALSIYQREWDETVLPDFIESILSIRLTTVQLKVLAIVASEQSGSTVQDLASTLEVSLATMSGIVERLESHGMIHRVLDPNDRRIRRVTATEPGKNVIRTLAAAQPPGMEKMLDRISTPDLAALTQGWGALLKAVREQRQG